jgi:transcriptional regulator with XRE-family HTH domain
MTKRTKKAVAIPPNIRSAGKGDKMMGQRVRVRRTELKMSQAELGDKLGVSFQQIQKYEKGVNRIGSVRLGKISEVLQVPISFFYDNNPKQQEMESMIYDDPRFSLRAIRAYTKIPNEELRHQLVILMEKVAASMPPAAA